MEAVTSGGRTTRSRAARRDLTLVLRVTGILLLTAGILVAGFVAYQLVVTDILAERAQSGLTADFEVRVATVQPVPVAFRPDDALPASPFAGDEAPPAEPGGVSGDGTGAASGEVTGPGVAEAVPVEPVPTRTLLTEPVPARGEAIGRISILSAGVDWTVVEGVGRSQLRTGAGHMPETPLPGQPGNAVISGHRTTYGAPFADLDRAAPGDIVTVETAIGAHTYEVVETIVVSPRDLWVVEQWEGAWLTLTTCHPRFSATERLVVVARMVGGPNAAAILGASA